MVVRCDEFYIVRITVFGPSEASASFGWLFGGLSLSDDIRIELTK